MQQLPTILPPPPLPDGSEAPARSQERQDNLIRFQTELEFVQCLSNPLYLRELAEQKYFADQAFVNYLKYLEYWREPQYVRFIVFPTCLVYLTLLQEVTFRDRLLDPLFIGELVRIGTIHHETWRIEKHLNPDEQEQNEEEKEEHKDEGDGSNGEIGKIGRGRRRNGWKQDGTVEGENKLGDGGNTIGVENRNSVGNGEGQV